MAEENPPAEEKKPNPILKELDKQAAEQTPAVAPSEIKPVAETAATPPSSPPEASAPAPSENQSAPKPSAAVEPPAVSGDSPDQLVSNAMQRLDEILKKVKQKKAPPAAE